ncbi:MAG: metallophosphoesterase family protein [Candidatus Tectomicrobia bacterium]|uniref:Phosphoesterase n=1 Tax=Tectimicrobiota bacterium TaxID=2528274 RepID=A0A932CMB2_UNCTE|nr:metallophosphoesterase family protein [Candidatus Tectomicrobia bacterium]
MRIGVLSDTHGHLDPRVLEIFAGVQRIFHAGDIGGLDEVTQLEAVAPVVAVRGNGDGARLLDRYPEIEIVWLEGKKILLAHIADPLELLYPLLKGNGPLESFDLVIHGHTHTPEIRERGGTLFFNPGAAVRKMCFLYPTVGLITLEEDRVEGEIVYLA